MLLQMPSIDHKCHLHGIFPLKPSFTAHFPVFSYDFDAFQCHLQRKSQHSSALPAPRWRAPPLLCHGPRRHPADGLACAGAAATAGGAGAVFHLPGPNFEAVTIHSDGLIILCKCLFVKKNVYYGLDHSVY